MTTSDTKAGDVATLRDWFFPPRAYYIEFDKKHECVMEAVDFHRSPQAVLHRINNPTERDASRWMGVAVSAGKKSKPVTMGRMLSSGDSLLAELKVRPLEDFAALVVRVLEAAPEVFEDPPLTAEVLEHTGVEVRHIVCADVLGYKAIVESDPGVTTRTRIPPRPGLEEATFGPGGMEIESTSVARSGPANLIILAHQMAEGRFDQIEGSPKDAGFCAEHLVVASDSLYGVYKDPIHALDASIYAIRWCLQSASLFSCHHAIRIGIGSGTSVSLCESNDKEEIANGLRRMGHAVAMYYGTGYVNAYLTEQELCKGRGPGVVAGPSFCEHIAERIEDLVRDGRLVLHPKEPRAFDVNYLMDLPDEDVARYRCGLEYLKQAYVDLGSGGQKRGYEQRFAESLREFDRYGALRERE